MKKILDWLKKAWAWIVKYATQKDFIMVFPFVVFSLSALLVPSFALLVAALIWLIPIFKGVDDYAE